MQTKAIFLEKSENITQYIKSCDISKEIWNLKNEILKGIEDHNEFARNYSKEFNYTINSTDYIGDIIEKIKENNFVNQYQSYATNFNQLVNAKVVKYSEILEKNKFHSLEGVKLMTIEMSNSINGVNSISFTSYDSTHEDILDTPGWIYTLKKNIISIVQYDFTDSPIFDFDIENIYVHPVDLFFNEYIYPLNKLCNKLAIIEAFENAKYQNSPLVLGSENSLPEFVIYNNKLS